MSRDEGKIGTKRHNGERAVQRCENMGTGAGTKVTRTERGGGGPEGHALGALQKGAVKDAEQLWKEGDPAQRCEKFPKQTGEAEDLEQDS